MDPIRWQQLKEIFEAALECSAARRPALLDRLCHADAELRREIDELLANDEAAGTFLEGASQGSPYSLPDGTRLGGRLRIVRALGRGGMGEVYEAYNEHARHAEAVKVLRPELSRDEDALARVVQEVDAARRVTHPNVCRIYDVDRAECNGRDILFLTMELIGGETLSQRLRGGGTLTAAEALPIVRQIAAGLDAAHAAGIVHRDFKTANVMLAEGTEPPRAVVMDFGLARRAGVPDQSLTATGMIVGTPAYMAPEQMEGAAVGAAADLYALGIVLHEMRTGSTHVGGAALEPEWEEAIRACLERDPARRPASATAVVARLEPKSSRTPKMRRFAGIAAVSIAIVALLALVPRFLQQRNAAAGGALVMLAPIQNSTQDQTLDAVTEVFRTQLRQSGYFRLWDPARLGAVLSRMAWPADKPLGDDHRREVAARDSVPFVVFGAVGSVGGELVISLRLDELAAGTPYPRRTWRHSFRAADKAGLYDAIHEGATWLRGSLGEPSAEIAARDRMPQETTSSSWAALADLATAERFRETRQTESAVAMLRDALRLDPEFSLARMRLGDLLIDQRKQQEGLLEWQKAVSDTARRRLTRREELLIEGEYANDTWDFAAAEAAFLRMEAEYPYEYLASFYLAHALQWQGRFDAAAAHMEAAARKQPNSGPILSNLASIYLHLHRFDALDRAADELAALPRATAADCYRGLRSYAMGRMGEAVAAFDRCAHSADAGVRSRGLSEKASLLAELGRYGEARSALVEGVAVDEAAGRPEFRGGKQLALAYLALRDGRAADARVLAWNAANQGSGAFGVVRAAIVLARSGAPADAAKLAARAASFAPGSVYNGLVQSRIRGEILLASGDTGGAVEEFRKTDALDAAIRPREYLARALSAARRDAEAAGYWRAIAERPELLWQSADFDFPGFQTDALFQYAKAAARAGQQEQAQTALKQYLERRGASPIAEVREAKQIAQKLSAKGEGR
jgi:eukaryotic-like serine/threonine-protein kinase